jgi:hypothetical protein
MGEKIKESAKKVAEICEARIEIKPRSDNRTYSVDSGESMDWVPKRAVWEAVRDIKARFGQWKDTSDELLWRINRGI